MGQSDGELHGHVFPDFFGGFGRGAVVLRGTYAAFGVGFDDEAGEVGDGFVDLIYFGLPPGDDGWIDGVEGGEMADYLWAGEVDGE